MNGQSTYEQKGEQLTRYWRNGGRSAKFNISSSIELLCKTEHLHFDFRHYANTQTVMGKAMKRHSGQNRAPTRFNFDTS